MKKERLLRNIIIIAITVIAIFFTIMHLRDSKSGILKALKKADIVSYSMKLYDIQTFTSDGFLNDKKTDYYIYKDNNDNLIAIKYERDLKNDKIIIYSDITINEDVELLQDEPSGTNYKYKNGKYSKKNRYNFNDQSEYNVTRSKSFLRGTIYSFELID